MSATNEATHALAARVRAAAAPACAEALLAATLPAASDDRDIERVRAHVRAKAAGLRDLADALDAPEDAGELFRSLAAFWLEQRFEWERYNQVAAYNLVRRGREPAPALAGAAAATSGLLTWVETIVPPPQLHHLADVALALLERVRPDVEALRSPATEPGTRADGDAADAARDAAADGGQARRLADASAALASVSSRGQTLVDGSTAVLCRTSVMRTHLAEVERQVQRVTARADDIAGRSRDAADATAEMRTLVATTADAVRELGAHARDIERISATLARLALETRFVGLNAAIEAARAGTAGVGFGVVAEKVRELADGASSAAEQIVTRLGAIRRTALASEGAMEEVGGRIGAIDACAGVIAASAAEQAGSVTEIAGEVAHLTATVDEIVAATEDMTEAGMRIDADAARARDAVAAWHDDADRAPSHFAAWAGRDADHAAGAVGARPAGAGAA